MAKLQRLAGIALAVALAAASAGCSTDADQKAESAAAPAHGGYQERPDEASGGQTDAREDPQSTFALDVDTASYGYASRLIAEGRRPAPEQIRAEEFVNAFDQDYPQPNGDGFTITADGARLPSGSVGVQGAGSPLDRPEATPANGRGVGLGHGTGGRDDAGTDREGAGVRLLRVGLQTRAEDSETRPDAALTFVVDVSGSMADPGRLDLVRDALHTLVDQLRPTDAVAIVAFNEQPRVLREMIRVSDADALHRAIDDLSAGGTTNLEGGLVTGYRVARDGFRRGSTNRVIILSDGLANVGNTAADPILRQVAEAADKQISLLGVGVGSEYGDTLMERLADRGNGFVVYVAERSQARELFVNRLPTALTVRALDAKAQVNFDPATVRWYRLIGYENRALADQDFRDDRVDGGEVGPGHSVTALYEARLAGGAAHGAKVAEVRVRWLNPVGRQPAETYESDLAT